MLLRNYSEFCISGISWRYRAVIAFFTPVSYHVIKHISIRRQTIKHISVQCKVVNYILSDGKDLHINHQFEYQFQQIFCRHSRRYYCSNVIWCCISFYLNCELFALNKFCVDVWEVYFLPWCCVYGVSVWRDSGYGTSYYFM